MPYALTWLPKILRDDKLRVVEVPDWKTRGHGNVGKIQGIMVHHTGGNEDAKQLTKILRDGRSDLPGPLAQLGLMKDGTFLLVAAGLSYHAGKGNWRGITTGNQHFIGIECVNTGDEPWSDVQMFALRRGCKALMNYLDIGASWVIGHKEYAPGRKVDPNFDMEEFRDSLR